MVKFQKSHFLHLLHDQTKFVNDGQSLNDFDQNKTQQLSQYFSLLEDYTFWNNRQIYIKILEDFVSNKIFFDQFVEKFFELEASDLKIERRIESNLREVVSNNFDINNIKIDYRPESYGFAALIFNLQDSIDICDPDVSLEENLKFPERIIYGLSEKFLKLEIENFFLPQMKEY